MRSVVVTAFTSDYKLGHLTWPVNKLYADRQGYEFILRIREPATSADERHPTWDKVSVAMPRTNLVLLYSSSLIVCHNT